MSEMKMPRMEFERRISNRLSRIFPVMIQCAESTLEVHALDVSPTGVRIVTPGPLQETDRFELELELEPQLRLSLTGTPVWQQALNRAGQHVVGLHFVGCADQEHRLGLWISEQQSAA